MNIRHAGIDRRTVLGGMGAAGLAVATAGMTAGASAATPSGKYRIDMHSHFLPPEYRKSLLTHGYITVGGYPTPEWSPEAALDFMDRYGIQAQALAISDPGVSYLKPAQAAGMARYINNYAADLIGQYPTRFGSLAVLPMPYVSASVAEARHALGKLQLDGVVLLSSYEGTYLGDPKFEPLMKELDRQGAYVFVHPAEISRDDKPNLPLPDFLYEFPFDTTRAATMLMFSGVIERYPSIRWQFSHAGGTIPFLAHRIGLASKIGQDTPIQQLPPTQVARYVKGFYYDTALSPSRPQMAATLAAASESQIVFGSDWPFSELTLSGSGDPQPELNDTFTASQRLRIERYNALRQLPRLAARVG